MESIAKHSDDDPQTQISSQPLTSSSSLPFGIANVLQSNKKTTKTIETNSTSNPWSFTYQQMNSSSYTALANASNWCARCSMHFRLTTDLVHHIRVHHAKRYHPTSNYDEQSKKKSSSTSIALQCHICHETFRQRHHLTRHMTSHR